MPILILTQRTPLPVSDSVYDQRAGPKTPLSVSVPCEIVVPRHRTRQVAFPFSGSSLGRRDWPSGLKSHAYWHVTDSLSLDIDRLLRPERMVWEVPGPHRLCFGRAFPVIIRTFEQHISVLSL